MNIADSSCWVEYFSQGPKAGFFIAPIQDMGEESALQAVGIMGYGQEVELDRKIAIDAARISVLKP